MNGKMQRIKEEAELLKQSIAPELKLMQLRAEVVLKKTEILILDLLLRFVRAVKSI